MGGTRVCSQNTSHYTAGGPTSFRNKGMLYVEETQTKPSIQVSRTSPHTEVCMYSALRGMVAGFARTKEQGSPGVQGPQARVGLIGTVLSCKERRIQLRRVNGKAGFRTTLQRTRRLGAEQGRHSHQTVSHAPLGNSLGWSVMIAEVP